MRHYGPEGQTTPEDLVDTETVHVFIESFAPPPQMWIFGAVDFTAALAKVAKVLGLPGHGVRCAARCSRPDVVSRWPTRCSCRGRRPLFDERGTTLSPRDAVCILTHDSKFDVPAVLGAVATRRWLHRRDGQPTRLTTGGWSACRDAGLTDPDQIARLMSPVGLDIGARTPEETAISICAEIIARRTGRVTPSLRDGYGAIHS